MSEIAVRVRERPERRPEAGRANRARELARPLAPLAVDPGDVGADRRRPPTRRARSGRSPRSRSSRSRSARAAPRTCAFSAVDDRDDLEESRKRNRDGGGFHGAAPRTRLRVTRGGSRGRSRGGRSRRSSPRRRGCGGRSRGSSASNASSPSRKSPTARVSFPKRSPGISSGMPGGYGTTCTARMRPSSSRRRHLLDLAVHEAREGLARRQHRLGQVAERAVEVLEDVVLRGSPRASPRRGRAGRARP